MLVKPKFWLNFFMVNKHFGQKKLFGQQTFWSTNFLVKKLFGQTSFWSKKSLGRKNNLPPKNIDHKNLLTPQFF
jgi:hypothetical protein